MVSHVYFKKRFDVMSVFRIKVTDLIRQPVYWLLLMNCHFSVSLRKFQLLWRFCRTWSKDHFRSNRRCSVKKVFLKILQNSQENTCVRVSFLIKLQAPHRCFPVNFAKIFRTPFYRTPLDDCFSRLTQVIYLVKQYLIFP